jgi:hypothetical protein
LARTLTLGAKMCHDHPEYHPVTDIRSPNKLVLPKSREARVHQSTLSEPF